MTGGLEAGTELAGYRIERQLGRGGMGLVYEAVHVQLGRKAALKLLHPDLGDDADFRERFVQESRLIAAIDHPSIIPIYDAGEVDGVLYIAMRYVDGADLGAVIAREGPLDPERALAILEQAGSALDAAHARDLVHRDVKPANVLVDSPGDRAFLTDFGIAKQARTRGPTRTGLFMGTVDYAPPEQIEGRPATAAADVYALGCVLYECVTAKRPFEKDTDVAVVYAHLLEPPPRVTDSRPELPSALDEVVATALAKAEGERFASCGQLVAAARAALAGAAAPAPRRATAVTGGQSPPAPVAARTPVNVPVPATALLGRDSELEALAELLRRPDVRLVTATGPGGTGKTRLAIELASTLADAFPDGVHFVSLGELGDASLVAAAVADALDVTEAGEEAALAERLRRRLNGARLLLVLDNFEHVLPAASLVAELLAGAARFKALVTSQAALRLVGEHEFPLPPLALPPPGLSDAAELARYPAVALFVQRARAVRPDFELTDDNAAAVGDVCRRLDGLPLALELAAARVKLLPPQAIRERLESRLALLTGGARDLPSRHQALRSTIDWSYGLLEPDEQALFARLAVFEGGWTLDAAEAVCGDDGDVFDALASLVDKSLVRQGGEEAGEPRFDLLQTIQEYARFRLIERGELESVRGRHAAHFLALAEAAEPELLGAGQATWVRRLDQETANLRAALAWSLEGGDLELGLRIAGALPRFWSVRGHMTEGRAWLAQALARGDGVAPRVRAKALFAAGYSALGQGDYGEAVDRFEAALGVYRSLGDTGSAAPCLAQLGWLALVRGEVERATALSEESLSVARELGDERTASVALSNLAEASARRGDAERATELFAEALELRRRLGDRRNIANALVNLGRVELVRGRDDRAAAALDEGLELASDVGDTWSTALARASLARLALRRGDAEEAGRLFREALSACRARGDRQAAAECLTGLAAVEELAGRTAAAARLWGAAEALREAIGTPASPLERSVEEEHLVDVGAAPERAAGRALSFEDAVRAALAVEPA